MTAWTRALATAWIAGCSGPETEAPPPVNPPAQGVVMGLRTPDGLPAVDVWGNLGGGSRAYPDSSGFVYYVDVAPGRIQVSVAGDAYATGHGAPDVQPGGLSVLTTVPLLLDTVTVPDPEQDFTLNGDGLVVQIPGNVAEFDGTLGFTPWTMGHKRIREADRHSVPGDQLGLRGDVDVSPIVLDEVFVTRGWNEFGDAVFPEGTPIVFTVDLPPDSPLLAPNTDARVFIYSGNRTYWVFANSAVIDPAARTATFESNVFGWWAIGREMTEGASRSCVTGQILDNGGVGLVGAEVRLYQDGILGIDRMSTQDGLFCLPIDPGATGELRLVGVDADRQHLFTFQQAVTGGSGPAPCGPSCVDLGTIPASVWPDADGDRSWAGPGGDCDDANPGVNPNPTLGDGSYCGESL